ncbi:MAG: TFIIB-type zinc ribbon-containing protein, partial [Haloferacaceae archaeon]
MTETDTTIREYAGADERERSRDAGREETSEKTRGQVRTCPECSGRLQTDTEHGETVCADCGLVV